MRIACYGFVEKDAGGVASANYLILEELLERGHAIDFYAKSDFVRPEELFKYPAFRYRGFGDAQGVPWFTRLGLDKPEAMRRFFHDRVYARVLNDIAEHVAATHREDPYDVMLFLGLGAQCAPGNIPVVSWVQGPSTTEWEAIRRLRSTIVNLCGWALYAKLKVFYSRKQRTQRSDYLGSDIIICGSQWARKHILRLGLSESVVRALPYPFDISLFRPDFSTPPRHPGKRTFLWLGRLDPRKRLDLLLEAYEALLAERRDVHLHVVGHFSYGLQYKRLITSFPYPDHISYEERIPREQVPGLINSVDALIQPSEYENFGSSVAEALCCGKPVILGPTNGTGEYIRRGLFAFEEYAPEAVKQAMTACLSAIEEGGERMALEICGAARWAYHPKRVVSDLEDVLELVAPRVEREPVGIEKVTVEEQRVY